MSETITVNIDNSTSTGAEQWAYGEKIEVSADGVEWHEIGVFASDDPLIEVVREWGSGWRSTGSLQGDDRVAAGGAKQGPSWIPLLPRGPGVHAEGSLPTLPRDGLASRRSLVARGCHAADPRNRRRRTPSRPRRPMTPDTREGQDPMTGPRRIR